MADEKVYYPEIQPENPFPGGDIPIPISQAQAPGVVTPTIAKDKPFKKKMIAHETIASALNTKSRKILQEFELVQSGAIQVGDFKQGISGDLRITPNGLTARDIAGLTTFAIDGTTGDATFRGTVLAGSVISEGSLEGGSININNNFVVDELGHLEMGSLGGVSSTRGEYGSLIIYNENGQQISKITGNGSVAYNHQLSAVLLSDVMVVENASSLSDINNPALYVCKINQDDGIEMGINKRFVLYGTSTAAAPSDTGAVLYVDQSVGKDRLMVRFNTGASQQLAIEP